MTIYLYVKQHSVTGLKYFGRTTKDPYSYLGSGKYWKSHLKQHGKLIDTIECWNFDNQEEATKFALEFSEKNRIVECNTWANLMIENALGGWNTNKPNAYSNEAREKIRQANIGKPKSEKTRKLLSQKLKGLVPPNKGKCTSLKTLKRMHKIGLMG